MADDYDAGAKGNLLKALTMMDRLLSDYETDEESADWTEHYNRSRLMLRNLEAKVSFLADDEYESAIEDAEDEFPDREPRRDADDKLEYLSSRLEALYELLQRKNVYQIKAVETPDQVDPIGADEERED